MANFRTIRPKSIIVGTPQTFMLHQILRRVRSSEISIDNKSRFSYQGDYGDQVYVTPDLSIIHRFNTSGASIT
jgi:hypothetical protein